jgi:hypothetical protein
MALSTSPQNLLLFQSLTQTMVENPHRGGIPTIILGVASRIEQVQESEEHCASGGYTIVGTKDCT